MGPTEIQHPVIEAISPQPGLLDTHICSGLDLSSSTIHEFREHAIDIVFTMRNPLLIFHGNYSIFWKLAQLSPSPMPDLPS